MGKTLSIWAVCLTLILAGFSNSNTPVDTEKEEFGILESENLAIYVDSDKDLRFFLKAEFNQAANDLTFLTKSSTSQIRIYNELGSMVYLLPVNSDVITISKSLLQPGEYIFNFDTENDRQMFSTFVSVK